MDGLKALRAPLAGLPSGEEGESDGEPQEFDGEGS